MMLDDYKEDFEINIKSKDGWTALMYASYNGFTSIVELLLTTTKAKVDAVDRLNRTPLHWAARFANLKIIKLLFLHGCKLEHKDID